MASSQANAVYRSLIISSYASFIEKTRILTTDRWFLICLLFLIVWVRFASLFPWHFPLVQIENGNFSSGANCKSVNTVPWECFTWQPSSAPFHSKLYFFRYIDITGNGMFAHCICFYWLKCWALTVLFISMNWILWANHNHYFIMNGPCRGIFEILHSVWCRIYRLSRHMDDFHTIIVNFMTFSVTFDSN